MAAIQRLERTNVPDLIFEQLKQSIIAGAWEPGDALPSEKQLADDFGVSRMSVRSALAKLQAFGLVEVRMGEGTFVIDFDPSVLLKGLSHIFAKPKNALEMIEFRKALEVECLKLGFKRADAHDIGTLESIYGDYIKAIETGEFHKAVAADYRFHHQVFLMSKNSLFRELYESLSELFFLHYDENERLYAKAYGLATGKEEAHGKILAAYKAGNLQAAIAAYTTMIDELVAAYLKKGESGPGRA